MPDYGHDIQFGYFLSPDAADAQAFEGQVGEHLGPMLGRPHDPRIGFSTFIFALPPDPDLLQALIEDVAPVPANGSQPAARS
jgi:hypothetical protein